MNPIGAHMSISGGMEKAFERVQAVGGECFQIFVKPSIQLETMAGAGSQLGCRLEQLRDILAVSRNPEKLGVCLDTCHVLAAGYDIISTQGYEDFIDSFQRLIGLDRLKCLHINDSKNPLGSHVDRHEQIGFGHLDIKTFERLLNDPRLNGLPFILETPKG